MSTVNKEILDLQGLTAIAGKVNEKLKKVTSMPSNPSNGDIVYYIGNTTTNYKKGCVYEYNSTNEGWELLTLVPKIENTALVFEFN